MHIRFPAPIILTLVLSAFGLRLLSRMNVTPGFAGYDYSFFIPRLFDGVYSFRAQGLLPPYYSPFLCGGFPFYSDPQSLFYSLPQFLSFLIDPWSAVQASVLVFLLLGGYGCYALGKKVFAFPGLPAVCCAVFFAANGFYRSRMVIGHLSFQSFMLLPLIVLALLYPSAALALPAISAAVLISYLIQSGAHYAAVFVLISAGLTAAFCFAWNRQVSCAGVSLFFLRLVSGAVLAMALCLSKLAAAWQFVSNMHRKVDFDYAADTASMLRLLYSQFVDPSSYTALKWGPWEYDVSLGPALWPLAVTGAVIFLGSLIKERKQLDSRVRLVWAALFIAGIYFILGMASGLPSWVHSVRTLPLIDQFRVNMRFSSSLILPLCLFAGIGFRAVSSKSLRASLAVLSVISCAFPVEALREGAREYMSFNLSEVRPFYARMASGEDVSPLEIGEKSSDDFALMSRRLSNPACYQTFYARPPTGKLRPAPIRSIIAGNFNAINPSCYWFPAENGCRPGALIKEQDQQNLELLLEGKNPGWGISRLQRWSNWLSLAAVTMTSLGLIILVWLRIYGRRPKS